MGNKTYLELAAEMTTAAVGKGYLRIPQDKGQTWEDYNNRVVHTIGWFMLEMYREITNVPAKSRLPQQKATQKKIIKP